MKAKYENEDFLHFFTFPSKIFDQIRLHLTRSGYLKLKSAKINFLPSLTCRWSIDFPMLFSVYVPLSFCSRLSKWPFLVRVTPTLFYFSKGQALSGTFWISQTRFDFAKPFGSFYFVPISELLGSTKSVILPSVFDRFRAEGGRGQRGLGGTMGVLCWPDRDLRYSYRGGWDGWVPGIGFL